MKAREPHRVVLVIAVIVATLSCGTARAEICTRWPTSYRSSNVNWMDRQTWGTVTFVAEAAMKDASANWGVYPALVATVMRAWAESELGLLRNSYHDIRTEPVDGAAAAPGQVGYVVLALDGVNVGATITAHNTRRQVYTVGVGAGVDFLIYTRPTQSIEEFEREH